MGNKRTQRIALRPDQIKELGFKGNEGPVIVPYTRLKRDGTSAIYTMVDSKIGKRLRLLGFEADHDYAFREQEVGKKRKVTTLYKWELQKPVDIETYKQDYLDHMGDHMGSQSFIVRYNDLNPEVVPGNALIGGAAAAVIDEEAEEAAAEAAFDQLFPNVPSPDYEDHPDVRSKRGRFE